MNTFTYPHVAITVTSIEETKNFYTAIGFKLVDEIITPEKKRHVLLLEGYNFQIEVFHFEDQENKHAPQEEYKKVGFLHFALPTDDLTVLKEKVIEQGIQLATDIRVTSLGVQNFTLLDPSGITVEFFEEN